MAEHSDFLGALTQLVWGELDQVNTAIPCKVISYDAGRVAVRPVGEKRYPDGDSNAFPVIHNLRVVWPEFANGQAGIKGPMLPGDNAMMIVCQQAIDDPDDLRRFDLVDSYVMPGGGGYDAVPGNADMRMYYGKAYIAISNEGKITINAPGGVEEIAPSHNSTADHVLSSATIGGINFTHHRHAGVKYGDDTTGGPTE